MSKGNNWNMFFIERQGDYGYHVTTKGKLVYPKPRKAFTEADVTRIIKRIARSQDEITQTGVVEEESKFRWWENIVNWLAEYMLDKIFAWASLEETAVRILWSFVMKVWMGLVTKLFPEDSSARISLESYDRRLKQAIWAYTNNGDHSLLDALLGDLSGTK